MDILVILVHNNSRPNVFLASKNLIIELDWEVKAHPAYLPDFVSSDYHLYRLFEHSLKEKSFVIKKSDPRWDPKTT